MRSRFLIAAGSLAIVWLAVGPAGAQQASKEAVPGVTNFARLETTVACAGATKVEVIPELKKMGFASIINLRQPTEAGADIDAEAVAARAAGMRYFSIPFDGPAAADRFLDAITTGAASRRSFTAPTAIVRPQCG